MVKRALTRGASTSTTRAVVGRVLRAVQADGARLDTRMATNWLHYKANYAQLTTLVVALGLLWWPTSLFALCVAAIASTACVTACPGRRIVTVGSYSVKLTTKNRALAAAVAAPLTLIFFGVLTWIALVFSFALVLPVAHMALRPRSLSARYNAASTR